MPLCQRRAGEVRQARRVRDVEYDDARRPGTGPDPIEERRVVGAERSHLRIHVGVRIGAAGAATERGGDHVHFVDAGEDRDQRRIRLDEVHLLFDEVAGDGAVVLLAERLKVTADDRRGNSEIEQGDGEPLGPELSHGDRHVAHPVRTHRIKQDARETGPDAVRVAGAHGGVNDCRPGRRWAARRRRTLPKS